jgi:hypothetical protein
MFFNPAKKREVVFKRRPSLPASIYSFPTPAKAVVPQWYKEMPLYVSGETFSTVTGNSSPKACMPLLDSMTTGYMMTLPYDLEFVSDPADLKNTQLFTRYQGPTIHRRRGEELAGMMPTLPGFTSGTYIWHTAFSAEVPKGYSMLYTHPLNNDNLPFRTAAGIMDNDIYPHSGSIPFSVQIGWSGIVPKGTPIIQMIPIKRESWIHTNSDEEEDEARTALARMVRRGYYRDNFWQKKDYE